MAGTIISCVVHDSSGGWNVGNMIVVERVGVCAAFGDPDYAYLEVDVVSSGVIVSCHLVEGGNGYSVADDIPNCPEPEGPTCLIDILGVVDIGGGGGGTGCRMSLS